jgi:hypothetical protein
MEGMLKARTQLYIIDLKVVVNINLHSGLIDHLAKERIEKRPMCFCPRRHSSHAANPAEHLQENCFWIGGIRELLGHGVTRPRPKASDAAHWSG